MIKRKTCNLQKRPDMTELKKDIIANQPSKVSDSTSDDFNSKRISANNENVYVYESANSDLQLLDKEHNFSEEFDSTRSPYKGDMMPFNITDTANLDNDDFNKTDNLSVMDIDIQVEGIYF